MSDQVVQVSEKRTAEQIAVEICDEWRASLPDGSRMNRNQLARLAKAFSEALSAARAEQRTVDAKIAEDYRIDGRFSDHYRNGAAMASSFIASAIRKVNPADREDGK